MTVASLSVQPAWCTSESTARSTSRDARATDSPDRSRSACTSSARRPSIISAIRYITWPRLYGVAEAQAACPLRAATTASRPSLREASAALAMNPPWWSVTRTVRPDSERASAPPM